MASNIAAFQNLVYRLNGLDMKIDDTMTMTRIILRFPKEYRYFSSAWDLTSREGKKIDNFKSKLIEKKKRTKEKLTNIKWHIKK